MRFFIDHTPPRLPLDLTHGDDLTLIGSCFAENIGERMRLNLFNTVVNPAGIIFNPISLADSLHDQYYNKQEDDVQLGNRFYSYRFHSSVWGASTNDLHDKILFVGERVKKTIQTSRVLFVTFGTAYYYSLRSSAFIAANCHKQPGDIFEKRLASVDEIVDRWTDQIAFLQSLNTSLNIVFTVSPVKYLRDGLVQNNISKATLLLAASELTRNNPRCFYFPAYELVNDDLRDYRFYKQDLAHPNDLAIDYVWQKLSASVFSERTLTVLPEIVKLNNALGHRSDLELSMDEALQSFISRQKELIRSMEPAIRF